MGILATSLRGEKNEIIYNETGIIFKADNFILLKKQNLILQCIFQINRNLHKLWKHMKYFIPTPDGGSSRENSFFALDYTVYARNSR